MRCKSVGVKTVLLSTMVLVALTLSTAAAKKVLTIHPWSSMGDSSMMEQIVAEYEALNPDVEIEIIGRIPTYEFLMKLMLMPQMPDIVECHLDWFPELMAAGIPAPLPDDLDAEARRFFLAPTLQSLIYDGRLYGIPTTYVLYSLGYHQDLFDDIGLNQVPQTWQELEQAARRQPGSIPTALSPGQVFSFPERDGQAPANLTPRSSSVCCALTEDTTSMIRDDRVWTGPKRWRLWTSWSI